MIYKAGNNADGDNNADYDLIFIIQIIYSIVMPSYHYFGTLDSSDNIFLSISNTR